MGLNAAESTENEMSEINMTPLVDVMLVLLIIFMVTVPVMKQAVHVELPRANSQPDRSQPEALRLSILSDGAYELAGKRLSHQDLTHQLTEWSLREPQPPLLIWGDRMVRYESVAQALALAQQAGLRKVGLVTDSVKEIAK